MDLFLGLRRPINTAGSLTAITAETEALEAQDGVRHLQDRVDRLVLLNQALWAIVRDATGVSDEELARRVQEIDAADGTVDGRVTLHPSQACGKCGRAISHKHQKCLFCGWEPEKKDAFGPVLR